MTRSERRASSASFDASEAAASSRGGALADETATALAHAWHPDALVASGAPGGEVDPDVADAAIELFADAFPRSALAIALRGGPPNAAPPPGPPEASSHATERSVATKSELRGGEASESASKDMQSNTENMRCETAMSEMKAIKSIAGTVRSVSPRSPCDAPRRSV